MTARSRRLGIFVCLSVGLFGQASASAPWSKVSLGWSALVSTALIPWPKPDLDWWDWQDSHNAKLTIKEMERAQFDEGIWKGSTGVVIGFEASGYKEDEQYEFWLGTNKIADLRVGPSGQLTAVNSDGSFGPSLAKFEVVLGGFTKGEAVNAALVSSDRSYKAFARLIPFSLEARQGRCRLWLELLNSENNLFVAQAEGFQPGERVRWISQSDGEIVENEKVATSRGELGTDILAVATVADERRANIQIIAESCSLRLDYEWGKPK